MNYPKNRLIVNGVDLTEKFKMVLSDGYTLTPPSPKTYIIDIPGGHGKLDLTESLFGDVPYDNRKQEFTFYIINVEDFEKAKTEISNMLHGRYFDYKITMDPEYTYKGRFTIDEYPHSNVDSGKVGVIKISIDGDPFKYKEEQVHKISCVGGEVFKFNSGRMRVVPTIETDGLLKIIFNHKLITIPKGTWKVNELVFNNGENEVYFNSFDIRCITWGDIKTKNVTWGEFKTKKLYEWYKSDGNLIIVFTTWEKLANDTWATYETQTWADITYKYEQIKDVKDSYIKYEWGDL